jgi:ribonuclease BN (tRNA processing enzyme)
MAKLIFLGTRGEIEEYAKKHKYHSSLLIEYRKFKILIDHGVLSKKTVNQIAPNAVLITHAHPDHYIWTKKDEKTQVPVYATKETINYGKFKPLNCRLVKAGRKFRINNFMILPYKVLHSIRCPAVGFKVFLDKKTLIYNPDLVDIKNKGRILKNVDYYIGDGSSIRANLVRKRRKEIFGHARIITQMNWCGKYNIKNIIFTHLGKETIRKEKEFKKKYPEIIIAYDGMKIKI